MEFIDFVVVSVFGMILMAPIAALVMLVPTKRGDEDVVLVLITLVILAALALGCATPKRPCFTTLELGVYGSQSDGKSTAVGEQWNNDDVTVGGSATMTFDFTGACDLEG